MYYRTRYSFSKPITTALAKFEAQLITDGLDKYTARQNRNYSGIYLTWLHEENIEERQARYKNIIAFIQELQKRKNSSRFINRVVLAVRHYYHYLKVPKNPAAGVYLRGTKRKVPVDIVSYKELLELYDNYQALDNRTKRNKVMLGLMIYQALATQDLQLLEPQHIKRKEGKIYIPGTKKSLTRVLPIQAPQLLELHEYIEIVRPEMLDMIPENKVPAVTDCLFFSEGGNGIIKPSLHHLFRQVKKLNPKITSTKVIRQSVITEWTKTIGTRQVQYMAGYRYVGSVERYKYYNLEELAEALNVYHPLRQAQGRL